MQIPRLPAARPAVLCAAAVLLVGLCYAEVLGGPFLWDDRPLILGQQEVRELQPLAAYFRSPFWHPSPDSGSQRSLYRPLTTLSYALDFRLHGEDPAGFHLTNWALHLLNCGLLLGLALRLRAAPGPAAAATLLWGLHPRLSESVSWISGRTDLLATTFTLSALLLWRARLGGARVLAALLLGCGLLCKEVAAVGALAIAAAELCAARQRGEGPGPAVRRLAPLLIPFIAYATLRGAALGGGARGTDEGALPIPLRGACALEALGTYLLMVLDAWQPRTQIGLLGRPSVAPVLLGGAAALALGAWLRRSARRLSPEAAIGAGVGLGALSLALHVVPLPLDVVAADRLLYLPLCGGALLLARWVSGLGGPRRQALLRGLLVLAATYGAALHLRNLDWTDEARFWTDAVRHTRRDNGRPLLELGSVYLRAGLPEDAARLYQAALAVTTPDQSGRRRTARANLASALAQLGRRDEAVRLRGELVDEAPTSAKQHRELGLLLLQARRFTGARAELQVALRLRPEEASTRAALATLGAAEQEAARLASAPGDLPARAELLARTGSRPEARGAWLELARQEGAPPALLLRAAAYLLLTGTVAEAQEAIARYAARAPGDPQLGLLSQDLTRRAALVHQLKEARTAWQDLAPPAAR